MVMAVKGGEMFGFEGSTAPRSQVLLHWWQYQGSSWQIVEAGKVSTECFMVPNVPTRLLSALHSTPSSFLWDTKSQDNSRVRFLQR